MRGIRPFWRVGALLAGALALLLLALPVPPAGTGEAGLGFSFAGAALVQKAKSGVFSPLLLALAGRAGGRWRPGFWPHLSARPRSAAGPGRRAYLLFRRLLLEGG